MRVPYLPTGQGGGATNVGPACYVYYLNPAHEVD